MRQDIIELVNIGVLPLILMVYSGVLVGDVAAFGHGITALESAHVVFLLAAKLFRLALLHKLISSFCSAAKLFRLALALALLCALISSFCSSVKLFRRALSRSRLASFLPSRMFEIGGL